MENQSNNHLQPPQASPAPKQETPQPPETKRTISIVGVGLAVLVTSIALLVAGYFGLENQNEKQEISESEKQAVSTPATTQPSPTLSPTDPFADWSKYANETYGYRFSYPSQDGWELTSRDDKDVEANILQKYLNPDLFPSADCRNSEECLPYASIYFYHQPKPSSFKMLANSQLCEVFEVCENFTSTKEVETDDSTQIWYYSSSSDDHPTEVLIDWQEQELLRLEISLPSSDECKGNCLQARDLLSKQVNQILSSFTFTDQKLDSSNWQTYTNTKYGFSFSHPERFITKGIDHDVILGSPAPPDSQSLIVYTSETNEEALFDIRIQDPKTDWYQEPDYAQLEKIIIGNQIEAFKNDSGRIYIKKPELSSHLLIIPYLNNSENALIDQILSTFELSEVTNDKTESTDSRGEE